MRRAFICAVLGTSLAAAEGNLERAANLYAHAEYAGAARLLNDNSRNPDELRLLGQCRFMLNDSAARRATCWRRLQSFAPSTTPWVRALAGQSAGSALAENSAFAIHAFTLAIQTREAFEKAVKLDPKNPEAVNDLFDFYIQAPGLVGGGVDKARALLPVLDKIDPVEAWHARGELDEQAKRYDSAEAAFRHAVVMEPANTGSIINLAGFLARRERYAESDEWFDRAARIEPDSLHVQYAKAETWVQSNRRRNEARTLLKQYLAAGNLTPSLPSRAEAVKLLQKAGRS